MKQKESQLCKPSQIFYHLAIERIFSLLFFSIILSLNNRLACHLFQFLHAVAANSAQNKMTVANLAIVFGPNLLPPNSYSLSDAGAVVQLAQLCIAKPKLVFEVRDDMPMPASWLNKDFRRSLKRATLVVMRSELEKAGKLLNLIYLS